MQIDRSLFIRGNRALGMALVEGELVNPAQQEQANARLMDVVKSGNLRGSGLLPILLHELRTLDEATLLNYQTSHHSLGLIDLRSYELHPPGGVTPGPCWTTWTLPFDEREGTTFLATAYYLSNPVRLYWEQLFGGNVVWYAATLKTLIEGIERLSPATQGA